VRSRSGFGLVERQPGVAADVGVGVAENRHEGVANLVTVIDPLGERLDGGLADVEVLVLEGGEQRLHGQGGAAPPSAIAPPLRTSQAGSDSGRSDSLRTSMAVRRTTGSGSWR